MEERLRMLLKRFTEEVSNANQQLEGYFDELAEEVNVKLEELGLDSIYVTE